MIWLHSTESTFMSWEPETEVQLKLKSRDTVKKKSVIRVKQECNKIMIEKKGQKEQI